MVVEISVSLVRKAHGNLSAEKLETLDIIHLNNFGIEEIDNLEVFDQIRELHLSGNRIKVIENLEFLRKLEYLDVSNNCIDSAGLRTCLGRLPSSLQTIVLGGNSCCEDEELLAQLNDLMPELGIVIGLEQRSDNNGEYDEEGREEEEEHPYTLHGKENDDEYDLPDTRNEEEQDVRDNDVYEELQINGQDIAYYRNGSGRVDDDVLLKSIVDRKCVMQNMKPKVDVANSIEELNSECASVLEQISVKAASSKINRLDPLVALQNRRQLLKSENSLLTDTNTNNNIQINAWLDNSKKRTADSKSFLTSLRENTLRSRDKTFSDITTTDVEK
jgi:hypothetical protein